MKGSTRILAGLLISVASLSGCMNRASSLRMLNDRADYEYTGSVHDLSLKEAGLEGFQGPIPIRTRPKVAALWIHPHEMSNHDYFWGGWMSVVVESDQWVLSKPGGMKAAPGIMDWEQAQSRYKKSGVRKPGARPKLKPTASMTVPPTAPIQEVQ